MAILWTAFIVAASLATRSSDATTASDASALQRRWQADSPTIPGRRAGRSFGVRRRSHYVQIIIPCVHAGREGVRQIASRVHRMSWPVHSVRSRVRLGSRRVRTLALGVRRAESGVGRHSSGVSERTPRVRRASVRVKRPTPSVPRRPAGVRRQWAKVAWCVRCVPALAFDVRGVTQSVGLVSHGVRRFEWRMRFDPHSVIVSCRDVRRLRLRVRLPSPRVARSSLDVQTASRSVQHRSRSRIQPCFTRNCRAAV